MSQDTGDDRLESLMLGYARLLARGAFTDSRESVIAEAVAHWRLGDRNSARRTLEYWGLIPLGRENLTELPADSDDADTWQRIGDLAVAIQAGCTHSRILPVSERAHRLACLAVIAGDLAGD